MSSCEFGRDEKTPACNIINGKNVHSFCVYKIFIYLLLVLTFYVTLLILNTYWEITGSNSLISQIRRFADAMLFALPILLWNKRFFLFPYILLVNLYFLSNVWYYRNYGTVMPIASYTMVENLHGLGPSIWHSIRLADVWILSPSICFVVYYGKLGCRFSLDGFKKNRNYILGIVLLIAGITLPSYIWGTPRIAYDINVVRGFRVLGVMNYWIYQLQSFRGVPQKEKERVIQFMDELKQKQTFPALLRRDNKNLILILVESLQSWPINLKVHGVEITPYLNSLIKEDSVLYFSKVLPQVKDGRSSDAQLLLNTGLLPIKTGAVSSLYRANEYPSLSKALAKYGYTSVSFICDDKSFWNQEIMSINYGFHKLYDQMAKGNPWATADENLFKYSLPILEKEEQPFYAQLVTLSGHDAVKIGFKSQLNDMEFKNMIIKYNLIITQYVDDCIGKFIESLKKNGLYEKSIIAIIGDHDAIGYNVWEGRKKCNLSDRYIPLFILNSPLKVECDKAIGESDVYPSLLDIMGVEDYIFRGLGESIFRKQSDCAVYHTGECVGNCTNDSLKEYKKNLWKISDTLIRMDYFKSRL